MFLDAVARAGLEVVEVPIGLGHANNRRVKPAKSNHRLQRRKDFLVREIARGAEKPQSIGMGKSYGLLLISRIFPDGRRIRTAWPHPKSFTWNEPRSSKGCTYKSLLYSRFITWPPSVCGSG